MEETETLKYLVIAPPRSGSTWFCNMLEVNGILREEKEQYESLHFQAALTNEDYKQSFNQIIKKVFKESECSYRGSKIQAFKLLSSQLRNLSRNILEAGGETELNFKKMLSSLCDEKTKIILLDRRKTEEMASSWVNAISTQQWIFKDGDKDLHTLNNIIVFHKFYTMFHKYIYKDHMQVKSLVTKNKTFLHLYYEDIQKDPRTAIKSVFEFLELKEPTMIKLDSVYRKQRTKTSELMLQRYKRFRPKILLDFLVEFFESKFGTHFKPTAAIRERFD